MYARESPSVAVALEVKGNHGGIQGAGAPGDRPKDPRRVNEVYGNNLLVVIPTQSVAAYPQNAVWNSPSGFVPRMSKLPLAFVIMIGRLTRGVSDGDGDKLAAIEDVGEILT
jgi:hypothetical protein